MVGWIPCDPLLRKAKMGGFLQRVEKSQEFGPRDVPVILQYDDRCGDMRPWCWPSVKGIPVRPDDLDKHRYTHYFKAPCCLCSFKNGSSSFNEAKIGLAQMVFQPGIAKCVGQYVAVCATQECDYFVMLERYFGHPNLMLNEYSKREKRVKVMNPFIFLTDDTEETMKRTGFRQIQVLADESNTGLRGTNRLLKREDPERFLDYQSLLKKLILKGLPCDKFWDLFIQCTACKYVMPRQYFPYYHPCVAHVVHRQLGIPKGCLPAKDLEETIDALLEEGDASDESDSDDIHSSIFAPTSRLASLPWVDPYASLSSTPERPKTSSRRA